MQHHPLLDRLTLLRDPAPKLHPTSGMLLAEGHRDDYRPWTGTVVAAGPGQYVNGQFCPTGPLLVPGARVFFAPGAGTPAPGTEYLLLREADVLTVLAPLN